MRRVATSQVGRGRAPSRRSSPPVRPPLLAMWRRRSEEGRAGGESGNASLGKRGGAPAGTTGGAPARRVEQAGQTASEDGQSAVRRTGAKRGL